MICYKCINGSPKGFNIPFLSSCPSDMTITLPICGSSTSTSTDKCYKCDNGSVKTRPRTHFDKNPMPFGPNPTNGCIGSQWSKTSPTSCKCYRCTSKGKVGVRNKTSLDLHSTTGIFGGILKSTNGCVGSQWYETEKVCGHCYKCTNGVIQKRKRTDADNLPLAKNGCMGSSWTDTKPSCQKTTNVVVSSNTPNTTNTTNTQNTTTTTTTTNTPNKTNNTELPDDNNSTQIIVSTDNENMKYVIAGAVLVLGYLVYTKY